jgi:site-specific DNA-methyltransferase (adenine-specific)
MATLTLHNGDCLAVMKDISANSIDLIICDLPYGCLANDGKNKMSDEKAKQFGRTQSFGVGCNWDVKIDLEKFWTEAKRILKNDHSPVIHFCTTKFGNELINSNPGWFRYDLVWDKQRGVSFLSANKMPMRSHEMIYVFSKAGAYYNRVDISGNFKAWKADGVGTIRGGCPGTGLKRTNLEGGDGKRCVLSVIHKINGIKAGNHPTEKPVELYRWLIERYCPPDGTVLDPTFGSGNSVFTAWDMGRHAIGIEKDAGFYEKAAAKLDALQ